MNDSEHNSSPVDRSKRPRLEEEVDSDYEHRGEEDRHPKRQAVPDPETKAPHFAGEEKKETRRSKKWTEGDTVESDDDEVQIIVANEQSRESTSDEASVDKGRPDVNIKLRHGDVHLAVRSLVGTRDAGVIIGRGGKNVNEIREFSNARVTISDIVPGAYERILTVNGPVESIAKAYYMVGEKILAEIHADDHGKRETTLAIRLLVPDSRMGTLIGRSGSIIKSIQEESGARLNASEEALPLSTERTMTIAGTPKSIHVVVARIADILAENIDRNLSGHIPFTPIANNPTLSQMTRSGYSMRHGAGGGGTGGGASGGHHHHHHHHQQQHQQHPQHGSSAGGGGVGSNGAAAAAAAAAAAYGMMPGMPGMPGVHGMPMGSPFFYQGTSYGGGMGSPAAGAPDYSGMAMNSNQSQQIFIPNEMVGCIIGKGGSKINEIRQISGSHIKIMDPHGDSNERLVTITGTHESNQMALYLLYSRLESEKSRLNL